jgi:hypothetical protein
MDGARNNFTMMVHLETLLESRSIHFDAHDCQIVCYAHCIDLVSKAAIGKLPNEALLNKDDNAILRNPITLARAVSDPSEGPIYVEKHLTIASTTGIRRDGLSVAAKLSLSNRCNCCTTSKLSGTRAFVCSSSYGCCAWYVFLS